MSFGEKVKARLDALEKQVAALDARLKDAAAQEPQTASVVPQSVVNQSGPTAPVAAAPKRGPGRPRKIVNG